MFHDQVTLFITPFFFKSGGVKSSPLYSQRKQCPLIFVRIRDVYFQRLFKFKSSRPIVVFKSKKLTDNELGNYLCLKTKSRI